MSGGGDVDTETLVRRLLEVTESRNPELYADVLTEDFTFQPTGLSATEYAEAEISFYEAFPDLTYGVEKIISQDDHVVFYWTFAGTHEGQGGPGPLAGIEPTGNEVEVTGINIGRVEDGRFAEMWAEWGTLELFDQLGVISLPDS